MGPENSFWGWGSRGRREGGGGGGRRQLLRGPEAVLGHQPPELLHLQQLRLNTSSGLM
jgi:hypothetical protein